MALQLGKAGELPVHPEARTIRLNAILQEEPVQVISPLRDTEELTRRRGEMWGEGSGEGIGKGDFAVNESATRTISAVSLVLGKKPRYRLNPPTKRKPPASQYTFLEASAPLPPLPPPLQPQYEVPKYLTTLEALSKTAKTHHKGLLQGVVHCLSCVSGSDVYVIDVKEASSDLHAVFQNACKDRLTLIHRSRTRIGAGSPILIVGPVCIDTTALFFVAAEVQSMQTC